MARASVQGIPNPTSRRIASSDASHFSSLPGRNIQTLKIMGFTDLGALPILLIAEALDQDRDLDALARVNRTLYHLVNPVLYRHNIQHSGNSAVKWGVSRGQERTVRLCLKYGAPSDTGYRVNVKRNESRSLVCIAAGSGLLAILKLLLEHGADPNCGYRDCYRIPVTLAVEHGHNSAIPLLQGYGADMNSNDDHPLYAAMDRDSVEAMKMLMAAGMDLEAYENYLGRTVAVAIGRNSKKVFDFLVCEQRLSPYDCNPGGRTALTLAAQNGHLEIAKQCLRFGLDPEAEDIAGRTAIYFAVMYNHLKVVELLLQAGVNPDKPDTNGRTPLCVAVNSCDLDIVNILLNYGANLQSVDNRGQTPLYRAVEMGEPDLVELLVNRWDVDVNFQAGANRTYLALAASNGDLPVVKMLLDRGADVNAGDFYGGTPMMLAATNGRTDVVKALIEYGIDPNAADHEGRTALAWACIERRLETVEAMLKLGIDPDKPDTIGRTALSKVAEIGNIGTVKVLLRYGANVEIRDAHGQSAVDYASNMSHGDVVDALKAHQQGSTQV